MTRRESLNPRFIYNMTTGSRGVLQEITGSLRVELSCWSAYITCWKLDMDNVVTVQLLSPAHYEQDMGTHACGASTGEVEAGFSLLLGEFKVSLRNMRLYLKINQSTTNHPK